MATRWASIWIAAFVVLTTAGCSTDRADGTRSVEDSLAEMERARKGMATTPPAPAEGDPTAEPADPAIEGSRTPDDPPEPAVELDGVPEVFKVKFESSSGDYVVEVHRDWAPRGAKRFYELVKNGFYDECRYFRVVPNFMVQFGMNGDPEVQRKWERKFPDDPVKKSNQKGFVTFATSGPNSRTTQIFISFADNSFLDGQGFAPFGQVIEGMHNVEGIFSGHAELPQQNRISASGNEYLNKMFPDLDYVKKATIIEESPAP